ncbi:MAG TPA: endonuclease domain-containing protein [Bacteroidia bacterium]|jgi:very-short-patch-repair endonuclease|nr:endonuclease domain-containing protein [Bacteroidia bacterium]
MKPIERPFYYGASTEILRRAEELRKNMTDAEMALWKRLEKNQLNGLRFRAQHPIGKFIVDFYCHSAKLVIELDGEIHKNKVLAERDEGRQYELEKWDLKVIRFKNEEVLTNIENVIKAIESETQTGQ